VLHEYSRLDIKMYNEVSSNCSFYTLFLPNKVFCIKRKEVEK